MANKFVIAATDAKRSSFIQAHVQMLPSENYLIEGASLPLRDHEGNYFFSKNELVQKLESGIERIGLNGLYFREKAIEKYLKEIKPDAVLAEYGLTGARMQYLCKRLNIPLFVYFLGYDAYMYWVLNKYMKHYRRFNENITGIFCVSKDIKNTLQSWGIREEILHYIPCGPNNLDQDPVTIDGNSIRFIAVGAFDQRKNPLVTIRAFSKVHQQVREAELHMVGQGPLLNDSKQLVQELGIDTSIKFHGWLNLDEINALYKQSRAFVQHSSFHKLTGDSEGTPVAILEASAIGLPVVSTLHAGIKDSVVHGKTGFLVEELDEDAMADYMLLLANDVNLARNLGHQGSVFIRENFDTKKSIDQMWSIISKNIRNA